MRNAILIFFLISVLGGCADFLNIEPQNDVSKDEIMGSIEAVEIAVNGAYNLLVDSYQGPRLIYPDVTGGNLKLSETIISATFESYYPVYTFSAFAGWSSVFDELYTLNYRGLYTVNNIIKAIPLLTDGDQNRKDQALGEALALRALFHFELLRNYAQPYSYTPSANHLGIVLVKEPISINQQLSRSSVAEAYELIIDDLVEADALLGNNFDAARMSRGAVNALLSRVYLYMGDWSKAAGSATLALNLSPVTLASNAQYSSIWASETGNIEFILRLDNRLYQANSMSRLIGASPDNPPLVSSQDLKTLYALEDIRSEQFNQYASGEFSTLKYPFIQNRENDIILIRLSEVILNRAEAYARLNRPELAQFDLNTIRLRANPSAGEIFPVGQELIDEILLERRKELAFEGHYLYDLTRLGKGISRNDCEQASFNCVVNYPSTKFVLPIPQTAIDANNNLEQNEDY